MNRNRHLWTSALVTAGVISAASVLQAEEAAQHPVMTALQSTTISGYVDTSAIMLFGAGNGTAVPGRSFDGSSKQNGFNLNVVSLTVEKPLDDSNWSAGYRAQLLFGPDANSFGSLSTLGGSTGDFAVKNAYVSLRAPVGRGLDFKFGVWDTLVGYEVFEAGNDPNYSRSYGYYLEPLIHTGVLASYKVSDLLSFSGGVANGLQDRSVLNRINDRAGYNRPGAVTSDILSYVGAVALTAPESMGFLKGATLYGGIVDTGIADDTLGNKDVLNFYGGATVPLGSSKFALGAAYDYRANGVFDGSYENSIGGYLTWQVTEKLKLNGRGEYATGSETAVGSSLGAFGVSTGSPVELLGVTGTLDYSLWANAITRLEVRWDHTLSGPGVFLDGTQEDAISAAVNVIYKF